MNAIEIEITAAKDYARDRLNFVADCLPLLSEKQHQLLVTLLSELYFRGRRDLLAQLREEMRGDL